MGVKALDRALTRRTVLRAGGGTVALALAGRSAYGPLVSAAAGAGLRRPDTVPDPSRPPGTPTAALPFDHLVVVMQENHSFDNYLGMLSLRGQPAADGFTFDARNRPLNANPVKGGYVTVQRAPSLCPPQGGASQSWHDTHLSVDGGRMDGFAALGDDSMVYWDAEDLPFYYSLARTFTLANRWFCSAPCQTYPNRRFLMAGTAFGLISTDTSSVTQDPPNGTIFDRLNAAGISWRNYYSDVPTSFIIASVPEHNPDKLAHVSQFYADCAAGTLPAVSMVDSEIGIVPVAADATLGNVALPFAGSAQQRADTENQDEEGSDLSLGENFVSQVVNAVLSSPAWPRILLVWLYDEHGGYYDHVPPPAAVAPDNIPPRLDPKRDPPGGYDVYGPRVPAVVVSGHARRNAVTNVVHDHTSILATIEAKWNLPALTFRDANAATMADFLQARPSFPEPPRLDAPSSLAAAQASCSTEPLAFQVHPGSPPALPGRGAAQGVDAARRLVVRFYGRRHHLHGAEVVLYTTRGSLAGLRVELRGRHGRLVAHAHVAHLGTARHRLVLRVHRRPPAPGRYTLVVGEGHRTLVRRRVKIG